jgi:PucR C-terminal helix-turn-helix domain/GGDEF-like domain
VGSRESPATSAALDGRSAAGRRRAKRVEALLAGESLDTSRLSYDFDADHVALVAAGAGATEEIGERLAGATGLESLVVEVGGRVTWGWLGRRDGFGRDDLADFASPIADTGLRVAIGEPAQALAGWRLSHHQARSALSVALRGDEPVVRYSDVALLASAMRDELLATSLCRLYLEPLADGRDGGEELRRTLRAYFAADRNVSAAGEEIGVTRQAVARRLRTVEERLGRSIASCGSDLELALRLAALEPASTLPFAP